MRFLGTSKFRRRTALAAAALILVWMIGIWLFGWGRGTIDIIDFSAQEVEYVNLGCAQWYAGAVTVRDPAEIQALIDEANAFRHAGSELRWIFRYGLFTGGAILYESTFFLKNGEEFGVVFASNEGGQPISDMEVSYWLFLPDGERKDGALCRGSLEVFYDLHQKYVPHK